MSTASASAAVRPGSRARADGLGESGGGTYPQPGRLRRPRQPQPPRPPERRDGPERQGQHGTALPKLVHPVIAGYDGSTSARHALAYAAGMAKRLGRPLLVAYVVSSGAYCESLTGLVAGPSSDTEALERWLLSELDQMIDSADLDVHVRARRGRPATELAAMASQISADALVIGAPVRPWHHVAGSVPGWLARHARCPVIVVP
jgi:nucleotide-binding universal stress UspA family protein